MLLVCSFIPAQSILLLISFRIFTVINRMLGTGSLALFCRTGRIFQTTASPVSTKASCLSDCRQVLRIWKDEEDWFCSLILARRELTQSVLQSLTRWWRVYTPSSLTSAALSLRQSMKTGSRCLMKMSMFSKMLARQPTAFITSYRTRHFFSSFISLLKIVIRPSIDSIPYSQTTLQQAIIPFCRTYWLSSVTIAVKLGTNLSARSFGSRPVMFAITSVVPQRTFASVSLQRLEMQGSRLLSFSVETIFTNLARLRTASILTSFSGSLRMLEKTWTRLTSVIYLPKASAMSEIFLARARRTRQLLSSCAWIMIVIMCVLIYSLVSTLAHPFRLSRQRFRTWSCQSLHRFLKLRISSFNTNYFQQPAASQQILVAMTLRMAGAYSVQSQANLALILSLEEPALGYILGIRYTELSLHVKLLGLLASRRTRGTMWLLIQASVALPAIPKIDFTAMSLTTVYSCPARFSRQFNTQNWRLPSQVDITPRTSAMAKRTSSSSFLTSPSRQGTSWFLTFQGVMVQATNLTLWMALTRMARSSESISSRRSSIGLTVSI